MATATIKREALKSINGIPDWTLKQQKAKDAKPLATRPHQPRASSRTKATNGKQHQQPIPTTVPPQPIKEEVKEVKEEKDLSEKIAKGMLLFVRIM
jgi:hypothetical protein